MPQGTAPDSLKYTNLYEESRRITEAKEKQEKRLLIGMFKAFACHIFPNHVIVVQEDKDRLRAHVGRGEDASALNLGPPLDLIRPGLWPQLPGDLSLIHKAKTRTLDLRKLDFDLLAELMGDNTIVFSHVEIVRMTKCTHGKYTDNIPFKAHTLVLFNSRAGVSPGPPCCQRHEVLIYGEHHVVQAPLERYTIPKGYKKIVVNMNGIEMPMVHMYSMLRDHLASVEDIVIVYPRYEDGDSTGAFFMEDLEHWEFYVLFDTANIVVYNPHIRITLVGLDRLPRDYLPTFRRKLTEKLEVAIPYKLPMASGDHLKRLVRETNERIQYVTRDQYVETVGEIRCRLETVEELDYEA